ncbi:four helix bundle protein [Janthinobacterium sp.]|uniref:four helix bundle protein n=1 Tax=Janthinobacterium sp. TaxID=1871054 RepID=UPI00293D8132|nr:four helix bundle protein [Janthinobacterium sp.]
MAIHTSLPIYKVAYELLGAATDLTKNMPRDYKASMGGKIRDECIEITTLIFRANVSRNKTPLLDTLLERVQVAELLFRLSRDKHFISIGQYARAIALTDQIGRQANGWRRHSAPSPVA